jgi:glutathione synthase/RimK-type ligase-like ATP-grasp enzyme
MILVLSDQFDEHADVVIKKLLNRGVEVFRLNLDTESLRNTIVTFNGSSWTIRTKMGQIQSQEISCVWLRRAFVGMSLQEQNVKDPNCKIWRGEWNKTLLGFYSSIRSIPWLNPLKEAYRAENKYFQMEKAKQVGLTTPPTIVSNDRKQLLAFTREHEHVVMKLMYQDFYGDDHGNIKGIYVNRLTHADLEGFGDSSENPIVLQAYIPKGYEVRYTVVGSSHHVCRIDSQRSRIANIDWRRYDIPNTPHLPMEPPLSIREKVTELLNELGINFGALDFIVTPSEDWYFLEVNPMGQWLWIEDLAGLSISDSIADWLTTASEKGGKHEGIRQQVLGAPGSG